MAEQSGAAKAVRPTKQGEIRVHWGSVDSLDLLFADNVHLALVNDQFYVTFGQTRVPVAEDMGSTQAEIRPVSRLVISKDAFKKIASLLARYVEEEK